MTIAHYSSSCAYSLLHACTWAEGEHRPPVALEEKGMEGGGCSREEGGRGYVVVGTSISSGRCFDQYRSMC